MKRRGKKKPATAHRALGDLPLVRVIEHGQLAPDTGGEAGARRARQAERTHVDALRASVAGLEYG